MIYKIEYSDRVEKQISKLKKSNSTAFKNMEERKIGLVLEWGAMRGLFTAGVLDVMLENDIRVDGIVGVSAGAAFGCNYKSLQPGRVIRYNKQMAHQWRFCSMRSLLLTGDLIGAKFAYHTLPNEIDVFDRDTYNTNPVKFYAVCTDVHTGNPVYKEIPEANDEAYEWIRASASMPLCSRVVRLGGYSMLDGGISDSIPLKFMQREGYSRNIVVLTQPEGYIKTPNRLMPAMRIALGRYPGVVKALADRHEMYNAQVDYVRTEEAKGDTLVIRPPHPLPIGHICHDPATMQQVYEIGRDTCAKQLDAIKNFIPTATNC